MTHHTERGEKGGTQREGKIGLEFFFLFSLPTVGKFLALLIACLTDVETLMRGERERDLHACEAHLYVCGRNNILSARFYVVISTQGDFLLFFYSAC